LIATYAVASQLDFDFAFASPLSDGSMNFLNVEDPANGPSEEGALANESHTAQQELVIYAIARRAQRIVAAGRAVLPEAPAAKLDPLSDLLRGRPARGANPVDRSADDAHAALSRGRERVLSAGAAPA
jgi:hypothetical protein